MTTETEFDWHIDGRSVFMKVRSDDMPMGTDTGEIVKEVDPWNVYPPPGARSSVVQLHARGRTIHFDWRIDVGDRLIGWTIAAQRAGKVDEVDSVEAARKLAQGYSAEQGNEYLKPWAEGERLYSRRKDAHGKEWLSAEGEIRPGSAGALADGPGFIVIVDRPRVELGAVTEDYREYFVTDSSIGWTGVISFRRVDGDNWLGGVETALLPYVVSSGAERRGWMPPLGVSALPRSLMAQVPADLRYWRMSSAESAKETRGRLVQEKLFTPSNVVLVDGEFRRVETKCVLSEKSDAALACVFCGDQRTINVRYFDRYVSVCRGCLEEAETSIDKGDLPPYVERQYDYGGRRECAAPDCGVSEQLAIVPLSGSRRSFVFACSKHVALMKSIYGGEVGSLLGITAASPFRLYRYSADGDLLQWELSIQGGPRFVFLEGDPFEGGEARLTGRDECGWGQSELNLEDQTMGQTLVEEVADEGRSILVDGDENGFRVEFLGSRLKGLVSFDCSLSREPNVFACRRLDLDKAIDSSSLAGGGRLPPAHLPAEEEERESDGDEDWLELLGKSTEGEIGVQIFKLDQVGEERIVGGIVLTPNVTDLQGDIYDEEEVRKAAHFFLEQYHPGGTHGMRMMHEGSILTDKIRVLESYVLPLEWTAEVDYLGQKTNALTIPKGTWIMTVRILDENLWNDIKVGKFTGFSIGAWARGTKV